MHPHEAPRLFDDILKRYERPLIRYAHGFTNDIEDARDVVQEVFLRLAQNLASLDEERLAPWLFTVCKNRALDHQRKQQRLVVMEAETLDQEESATPMPGSEMEKRETALALRQLIDKLPPKQREAVRLKFIAGLDYRQISQVMKTSMGNVGYLIHHGVRTLRTRWLEMENETPGTPITVIPDLASA